MSDAVPGGSAACRSMPTAPFFSLSLPPVLDLSRGFVTLFYIFLHVALVSALLLTPVVPAISYPTVASKSIAANR